MVLAETKQNLIDKIIVSHDNYQREIFHSKQRRKMEEENYETDRDLSCKPIDIAVKMSMTKSPQKLKAKKYQSGMIPTISELKASQSSSNITPRNKQISLLNSTQGKLSMLFSPQSKNIFHKYYLVPNFASFDKISFTSRDITLQNMTK